MKNLPPGQINPGGHVSFSPSVLDNEGKSKKRSDEKAKMREKSDKFLCRQFFENSTRFLPVFPSQNTSSLAIDGQQENSKSNGGGPKPFLGYDISGSPSTESGNFSLIVRALGSERPSNVDQPLLALNGCASRNGLTLFMDSGANETM